MDRFHGPTLTLPIDTPGQRAALLRCSLYVREREEGKRADERGFGEGSADLETGNRHIAEVTAVEEQLEAGRAIVHIPLRIADALEGEIAEYVRYEMAQIAEPTPDGPRGVHIRQGAEIMATLLALDAALEREVMPLAR
jgi:hypothetical protein